jgi:hypothetical protein
MDSQYVGIDFPPLTRPHSFIHGDHCSSRQREIGHHAYSRARRSSKPCPSSPVTCRSPSTGS